MGARLVSGALQPHWARTLSANARLVLVAMCLQARDTATPVAPAATFWGGHDDLILRLRGEIPDPGTPQYRTAVKQMQRIVAELIEAGAVERVGGGYRGHRTEYRVMPHAYMQPVLPERPSSNIA